jgi:hypothetical protein
MKIYKIDKYNLGTDCGYCFENEDKEKVVAEALRLCTEDNGQYTYRMETWENHRMIGGWKFFQDGKEFTGWLRDVLAGEKKYETHKN